MKKTSFVSLCLLLLGSALSMYAEQRTAEDVMRIAASCFNTAAASSPAQSPARMTAPVQEAGEAYYIIRNNAGPGFVIVSADDRMPAVLGYSAESRFPEGDMPEHVRYFLHGYTEALQAVEAGSPADEVFPLIASTAAEEVQVGPLLGGIMFDQGYPYNYYTPTDKGRQTPSGCVATAMAQIMRYYKYPAKGTGTFVVNGKKEDVVLDNMPFDWDNIRESYTANDDYTPQQAEAVGRLLYACGAAVYMEYSASGSSSNAEKMIKAMRENFDYNSKAQLIQVSSMFTPEELIPMWVPDMMSQLQASHPIFVAGGASISAGHAFVIDGYKAPNATTSEVNDILFHLNWGWSGLANGYYYLNNLTPKAENDEPMSSEMYQNFSKSRCSWTFDLYPSNYTAIDDVEQLPRALQNGDIYTVLGTKADPNNLQPNTLYIHNGKKLIVR